MKRTSSTSTWMIKVIALGILLYSHVAMADRTVSIVIDAISNMAMGSGFKLANPSPVTVSYGMQCFSPSGYQMISNSGQTLAPNSMVTLGNNYMPQPPTCADGTTPSSFGNWATPFTSMVMPANNPGGMVYGCESASGVSYATRAQVCGSSMHACSLEEVSYVYGGMNASPASKTYWVGLSGTTFSYSNDSFATNNLTSSVGNVPIVTIPSNSDMSPLSTMSNGCKPNPPSTYNPAQQVNYCAAGSSAGTATGTLCCNYSPDFSQGGMCKLTIESATPVSGHLQSPSFKGGSPF